MGWHITPERVIAVKKTKKGSVCEEMKKRTVLHTVGMWELN
jgi:hypothetical protein